jgi:hypothetical protein
VHFEDSQSITHQRKHKLYIIHLSKIYYIKTLKMLLHVSILRSSSGSTYCSLLKLRDKIVNTFLYLSVIWQHFVCLCMLCFQCMGVWRVRRVYIPPCRVYIPPCIEINVYANERYTICCHITDKCNDIFAFLTSNFSKEQYVLPEDDLRIEICRSILSVLM